MPQTSMPQTSVVELVTRAADRDELAWREIIERYSGLVWSVTRTCGLPHQRAADVVQTVWLRLVQHIGDLREPEHLGGWLATTTRREAIRTLAIDRREDPQADIGLREQADRTDEAPDARLLRRERHDQLSAAMDMLTERQQQLLRLLALDPTPSYVDISAMTGMPIGSIGPTRARAITRLNCLLDVNPESASWNLRNRPSLSRHDRVHTAGPAPIGTEYDRAAGSPPMRR